MVLNKEEIEMKKKELMLHYERMLIDDTEGTLWGIFLYRPPYYDN